MSDKRQRAQRLLELTTPPFELPYDHLFRRLAAMDWAYKRLHLLDEYVALGVMEAVEVRRSYWDCRRGYGDLALLEQLEAAILALEAEV